jgi:hypothetical protein
LKALNVIGKQETIIVGTALMRILISEENTGYMQEGVIASDFSVVYIYSPIPLAARSKASVCGRSLAGIMGWNPTGRGCLSLVSGVCCQVEISVTN